MIFLTTEVACQSLRSLLYDAHVQHKHTMLTANLIHKGCSHGNMLRNLENLFKKIAGIRRIPLLKTKYNFRFILRLFDHEQSICHIFKKKKKLLQVLGDAAA